MMAPHEAATAFLNAMRAEGVEPSGSILNELMSGDLVRFHCEGDTAGRRNGWAKLHLDERPAGSFGTHKGEFRSSWIAERPAATLSPADRAAYRAKRNAETAAKAAERAARHKAVAIEAEALIGAARPATAHPYLSRKRISGEGLFISGRKLLVPMQDEAGRIWNVQRIYEDGTKLFLKGGRVDGLFWLVDTGAANCAACVLCIGEGVGTMAAVRRATGYDVAAAISANNLEPCARALRSRWPDRKMIVCADDDAHLVHHPRIRRNIGVDAAKAAAAAIGASVALPPRSHDHG
jgi:putative DNA primase/helicase